MVHLGQSDCNINMLNQFLFTGACHRATVGFVIRNNVFLDVWLISGRLRASSVMRGIFLIISVAVELWQCGEVLNHAD